MTTETDTPVIAFPKQARIEAIVCVEPGCLAAIPVESVERHAKWHEMKRRKL